MSDLFNDALGEFHAVEAANALAPTGSAAVRATVAHRRRVKITTLSVLGVLMIAIPVAAFAANPRGNNPPPGGAVSSSPSPVTAPTPAPSPTATPSQALAAKFTVEQLTAAKVAIPAAHNWSHCPRNLGTKLGGEENEVKVSLRMVVHTNLDSDPAAETAALFVCNRGDSNVSQIAAYDIDMTNAPVLMGTVFAPATADEDLVGLRARADGGVVAIVTWQEEVAYPGHPDDQEREFAWDGSKFVQVGGPTAFPPQVSGNLALTSPGALNLGPSSGGRRTGTLSVTVKNLGSTTCPTVRVEFQLAVQGMRIAGASGNVVVTKPPLGPGDKMVVSVRIEVDDAVRENQFGIAVYSHIKDTNPDDNQITVAINRA